MLIRIFIVALFLLAGMLVIKDGRVLRHVGLTASCRTISTAVDGSQWEQCRAGRLEGRPDLTSRSCTAQGMNGKLEFWRCPAELGQSEAGR